MARKTLNDLTAGDLDIIYMALNAETVKLQGEFDLHKRDEWGTGEKRAYYRWERLVDLKCTIYDAELKAEEEGRW